MSLLDDMSGYTRTIQRHYRARWGFFGRMWLDQILFRMAIAYVFTKRLLTRQNNTTRE